MGDKLGRSNHEKEKNLSDIFVRNNCFKITKPFKVFSNAAE